MDEEQHTWMRVSSRIVRRQRPSCKEALDAYDGYFSFSKYAEEVELLTLRLHSPDRY